MAKRRKGLVSKTKRRSRTATATGRSGDLAWKRAERDVARYFGTERVGLGRAGHDLAEMPTVQGWLSLRAPELLVTEGPSWHEPFTHIVVDSKCHKTLIPTLEQWQAVVQSNPDKTHYKPVLFLGTRDFKLPPPFNRGAVGLCKLEDFPLVYRSFLAHPPGSTTQGLVSQLIYRFWMIRRPVAPLKLITDAIHQAKEAGANWTASKVFKPEFGFDGLRLGGMLPVAYLYYPKRLTAALAFVVSPPS